MDYCIVENVGRVSPQGVTRRLLPCLSGYAVANPTYALRAYVASLISITLRLCVLCVAVTTARQDHRPATAVSYNSRYSAALRFQLKSWRMAVWTRRFHTGG